MKLFNKDNIQYVILIILIIIFCLIPERSEPKRHNTVLTEDGTRLHIPSECNKCRWKLNH